MTAFAPYEYKAVPAPAAARRIKGAKGPGERFARTLEQVLGEESAGGWEFLRAEILPVEERRGLFRSRRHEERAVLIFRRVTAAAVSARAAMRPAPPAPAQAQGFAEGPALAPTPPAQDPDAAWARARAAARPAPEMRRSIDGAPGRSMRV
ncbi:MAG: DUF4177 domain-containing protein, partial [Pseudomonadota bacterium]